MSTMRVMLTSLAAITLLAIGALVGTGVVERLMANGGNPDLIHACVHHSNGKLRIVGAGEECKKNETPLDWNIEGPSGLPGPQGEQGPKGDPGTDITNLDWDAVTNKPAGFADGEDGDALGSLSCDANQLARWDGAGWECFFDGPTITKYHAPGVNGEFTSLAIGSDGFPLITFLDRESSEIKVAHCQDFACTAAAINVVDSAVDGPGLSSQSVPASITIGGDGLGLIAYIALDGPDNDPSLKVAHCENLECSSLVLTAIDATETLNPNRRASITTGTDGFGLIAYKADIPNQAIKVAHCEDFACSSSTTTVLALDIEDGPDIAIGVDGFGIVVYQEGGVGLRVAHCTNKPCTAATFSSPSIQPGEAVNGFWAAITIGADGLPLIAHRTTDGFLKATHCDDVLCTSATNAVIAQSVAAKTISIDIGVDGLALIAIHDFGRLAHCENVACSDAIITSTQAVVSVFMAVGNDGLPVMSSFNALESDLFVVHCPDPVTCAP